LLIFLKEKKSGAIKARSCANGSVQREHVAKEEAATPRRRGGSENTLGAKINGAGATMPPQQLQLQLWSKQQPTIVR
jgi:hypothetical protein